MKRAFKIIIRVFFFLFLTGLTQVGGVLYVLSLIISKKRKLVNRFNSQLIFIVLYLGFTFLIIPFVAPIFGREKVKHTDRIKPTNYFTVLFNRNYVRPELNKLLFETETILKGTGIHINYLDANFPFLNKFPLPPHLSHNDGRKIDLSLVFENENGKITNKQKSISGYGVFESPTREEENQIDKCIGNGYFQYDYSKYLSFGTINRELSFSDNGNKELINALLENERLQKIFIEPHLKERMKLTDDRIRYHGCRAVRHDDHIHIQIK